MALGTFSAFYYGITVTTANRSINFDEGSGELEAQIQTGTFSLTDFLTQIKSALDNASTLPQAYTVSVDRDTRQITISAANAFDLLITSGAQVGTSAWSLMGFSGADVTGLLTYTGGDASGSEYITQFPLQDYVLGDHNQERIDASINESANGDVEVISFGIKKMFEMSFKYITDKVQDGHVIRNNSSGISDAINFFSSINNKGPLEFMPDVSDRSTFFKVLLESTGKSSKGVGFKLNELTGQNLPGYFEVNNIKMRVIE